MIDDGLIDAQRLLDYKAHNTTLFLVAFIIIRVFVDVASCNFLP